LLAESQLDDPCLFRVQLQAEPVHDETEAAQRLFRIGARAAWHDGIVGIPHQLSQVTTDLGAVAPRSAWDSQFKT